MHKLYEKEEALGGKIFGKRKKEQELTDWFNTAVTPAKNMVEQLEKQRKNLGKQLNYLWGKKQTFFQLDLERHQAETAKSQAKYDKWAKNNKN